MSDFIADLEMAYLGEAMSDSERKQAAAKIFRMHQAKQAQQLLWLIVLATVPLQL